MAPSENCEVSLDFTQAPNIVNSWNANVSASGNQVTASNLDWNGHIAEGSSTSFGLQGTTSSEQVYRASLFYQWQQYAVNSPCHPARFKF
ncbi:cellulose binding domain-containing protein [Vibrio sp. PP-XX7]